MQDKLFIRAGVGLGAWGSKYTIGIKYDKTYHGGWSYCVGFSNCPGLKDVTVKIDKNGDKQEATVDYLTASTMNFSMIYGIPFAKTSSFNIEFGYAVPLQSEPWKITKGANDSEDIKKVLNFIRPGGLMLGLGLSFGL